MTLAMVRLAITGGAAQVAHTRGIWPKARLSAVLIYLFVREFVGFSALIPSALRANLLHCALPSAIASSRATISGRSRHIGLLQALLLTFFLPGLPKRRLFQLDWPWRLHHRNYLTNCTATIARDIRYGRANRNLLDIYVPASAIPKAEGSADPSSCPVLVFVHGGVWSTGSKELFTSLGAYMAQVHGIMVVVVQYTLFPEVLAWQQVKEVSEALSWVMDNAGNYGGDSSKITIAGHSAGGHLAAMVVWERFKAGLGDGDGDVRQPWQFMGLSGVYDIVEHLEYETQRGVAWLSCMKRAMGGEQNLLEEMSPVMLFRQWANSNSLNDRDCRELMPARCRLLCSDSDMVVPAKTSRALDQIWGHEMGVDSALVVLDGLSHGDFVRLDDTSSPESVALTKYIVAALS